jgi:hypothetical protein
MDISFLIVNGENYDVLCKKVVDNIIDTTTNHYKKYSFEIIISSFEQIKDDRIINIIDTNKKYGNTVKCYNEMYKASKGKYIFILNDDHKLSDGCLDAIELLKSNIFNNRKLKITAIGAPLNLNKLTATRIPPIENIYNEPTEMIMGYPVFDRETVENYLQGVIFNQSFLHHYADNFLPFFISKIDGEPIFCLGSSLNRISEKPTSYTVNDSKDFETYEKLVKKFFKNNTLCYNERED